tara:strand:- start:372 stop:599 length:228 start_codon:yes stop_codon:yes gene_type:complete
MKTTTHNDNSVNCMMMAIDSEIKELLWSALNVIEEYKERTNTPSNENPYNEVEAAIEDSLWVLSSKKELNGKSSS